MPVADPQAITVVRAGDADRTDWDDFVARAPAATVFHRWPWRGILEQVFGHRSHYLIARRGSAVAGVLPLAEVSTLLFGHTLVSLPFCSWAGPIADDDAALAALDRAAIDLAQRLAVSHLEYRQIGASTRGWPAQDLYVRFSKPIIADHDANLQAIPRKQRAMIRKATVLGLTAASETVAAFYPLYADNVHRHGTPACPPRFFEAMQAGFGDDFEVLIVRDRQGRAVSGVVNLYFRKQVLPFYAGDLPLARDLAANDFKYWEVMRRAAGRGCDTFDFGRSKRGTGSFEFKRHWGFQPQALSYEYCLLRGGGIPQNNPLNPKYRLLIATWRRLPRGLVNALGPVLVKGLG